MLHCVGQSDRLQQRMVLERKHLDKLIFNPSLCCFMWLLWSFHMPNIICAMLRSMYGYVTSWKIEYGLTTLSLMLHKIFSTLIIIIGVILGPFCGPCINQRFEWFLKSCLAFRCIFLQIWVSKVIMCYQKQWPLPKVFCNAYIIATH